jgi:hypothetical protein
MISLSRQYQPPDMLDLCVSKRQATGLESGTRGADVVHYQHPVSSQPIIGAPKCTFDVIPPLLGVEAHLGDGALDPEQPAIHDGQTCLAADLLCEKGCLIIPSFTQTGSVQRHRDDGLHGKRVVFEVFGG